MKKILMFLVVLILLTACGKTDELQTQVDDLSVQVEDLQMQNEELQAQADDSTAQAESLTDEVADMQSELGFAESAVSLCVTSLEEEIAGASSLSGTLAETLDGLAASEDDLQACLDELEAETTESDDKVGGGEGECAGTERVLMMSTPVLQQAVDKNGKPRFNANNKMIMVAIPNSRVEDFIVGDTVCVTEHYPVSGGWAVFLISGTRTANYNLFIPAHYLEPLPEEPPPFVP